MDTFTYSCLNFIWSLPVRKIHGANMGTNWGRQDPGGPRVGPAAWVVCKRSSWVYKNPEHRQNNTGFKETYINSIFSIYEVFAVKYQVEIWSDLVLSYENFPSDVLSHQPRKMFITNLFLCHVYFVSK